MRRGGALGGAGNARAKSRAWSGVKGERRGMIRAFSRNDTPVICCAPLTAAPPSYSSIPPICPWYCTLAAVVVPPASVHTALNTAKGGWPLSAVLLTLSDYPSTRFAVVQWSYALIVHHVMNDPYTKPRSVRASTPCSSFFASTPPPVRAPPIRHQWPWVPNRDAPRTTARPANPSPSRQLLSSAARHP